jgi:hypothetical protein
LRTPRDAEPKTLREESQLVLVDTESALALRQIFESSGAVILLRLTSGVSAARKTAHKFLTIVQIALLTQARIRKNMYGN